MKTVEWRDPWQAIHGAEARLEAELEREFPPEHPLCQTGVRALARRVDCEDVLFELPGTPTRYAVVRLTWQGKRRMRSAPPVVRMYNSFPEFQEHMTQNGAPLEQVM